MTNKHTDRAITMAEFLRDAPPELMADAEAHGIDLASLEAATQAFNELDIPEPKYGEDVLGTLTEEELRLFVVIDSLSVKLDDLNHEIGGEALMATGAAFKARDVSDENIRKVMETKRTVIEQYFKYERQLESYKSRMFLSICNRLGHWDWLLGIRSKQRIVKVQRKW